jgi:hypothetical protein
MKNNYLLNTLSALALGSFLIGCSGDDDADPPPMVDCNVTGPTITLAATNSACGQDDGEIAVNITGGTGNLTVTIDPQLDGVDFANNTFTNVMPGNYTVEVTDQDNCATSSNVTVEFTASNISYAAEVDPIIQASCAIPNCHDGSNANLPNFTVFSELQSRANDQPGGVRQRVKSGDMPRGGGTLQPDEIAAILCWVDEGAQEN